MWLFTSVALGAEPLDALFEARTFMARKPVAEALCAAGDASIAAARAAVEATPDSRHFDGLRQLVSTCEKACAKLPDCAQREGPTGEIAITLDWLLARAAPGTEAFRDPAANAAEQVLKSWFFHGAADLPLTEMEPIRGSSTCPPREGPYAFHHAYAWGPDWRAFTWQSGYFSGDEIWHRVNGAWILRFVSSGYS